MPYLTRRAVAHVVLLSHCCDVSFEVRQSSECVAFFDESLLIVLFFCNALHVLHALLFCLKFGSSLVSIAGLVAFAIKPRGDYFPKRCWSLIKLQEEAFSNTSFKFLLALISLVVEITFHAHR